MIIEKLIDENIFERIDDQTIKAVDIEFKWWAIFYIHTNPDIGCVPHIVTDKEWHQLKRWGFGITSCTFHHNHTHFTNIVCEGIHPNLHPTTKQFCMKNELPISEEVIESVFHGLHHPNFKLWYTNEWGTAVWKPVFEILEKSEDFKDMICFSRNEGGAI